MSTQLLNTSSNQAIIETEDSLRRRPTPRELEALQYIASGLDSKTTAKQMDVSKRTVDFHLANVYVKLDANNRVQAINNARNKGYL